MQAFFIILMFDFYHSIQPFYRMWRIRIDVRYVICDHGDIFNRNTGYVHYGTSSAPSEIYDYLRVRHD